MLPMRNLFQDNTLSAGLNLSGLGSRIDRHRVFPVDGVHFWKFAQTKISMYSDN